MTGKLDVIVTGGADYERFVFLTQVRRMGVTDAAEITELKDFRMALMHTQKYDLHNPVIVFLGDERLIQEISKLDLSKRPPYVVKTFMGPAGDRSPYDAELLCSSGGPGIQGTVRRLVNAWNARRRVRFEHTVLPESPGGSSGYVSGYRGPVEEKS